MLPPQGFWVGSLEILSSLYVLLCGLPACSELALHILTALLWDLAGWGTCNSNLLQQAPEGKMSGNINPLLKSWCVIVDP